MGGKLAREAESKAEANSSSKSKSNSNNPVSRVLSGVYDIFLLTKIQALEDEYRLLIGKLVNTDPDSIPFDFDLMNVQKLNSFEERKSRLIKIFQSSTTPMDDIINTLLEKMIKVDAAVKAENIRKDNMAI